MAGISEWAVREGEEGACASLTSILSAGEGTAAEDGVGGGGGVCWPVTGIWAARVLPKAEEGIGDWSLAAEPTGELGSGLEVSCVGMVAICGELGLGFEVSCAGTVAICGLPGVGETMRCTVWTLLTSA